MKKKQAREVDIAKSLAKYDQQTNRKGETLPEDQKVYRARVVLAFMESGIPLSKLDSPKLRDLLEENAFRLTDSRHLLDMVPYILQEERSRVRDEVKGRFVSAIFDGTTRLGEVLVIVLRFIQDWSVCQRLVRVDFLQQSMNGQELARQVISALSVTLGVESDKLIAVMRDGASVNGTAMRLVSVMYPNALDIRCLSHLLDLVGDKFQVPTLNHFMTLFISLFSHSPRAKALWKNKTGRSMASYSATRWWSRWELYQQLLVQFGDVQPFWKKTQI